MYKIHFSCVNEWKSLYRINSQNGLKQVQLLLSSFSCLIKEKAAWKMGDFGYLFCHEVLPEVNRKSVIWSWKIEIKKSNLWLISERPIWIISYDKLKGSSNPNHFILKFNVSRKRIRHITILSLNLLSILSWSRNS